jgi:hypothetical protein
MKQKTATTECSHSGFDENYSLLGHMPVTASRHGVTSGKAVNLKETDKLYFMGVRHKVNGLVAF